MSIITKLLYEIHEATKLNKSDTKISDKDLVTPVIDNRWGPENDPQFVEEIGSYLKTDIDKVGYIIGKINSIPGSFDKTMEYTDHMPEFKSIKDTKIDDGVLGTLIEGVINYKGKRFKAIEFTNYGTDGDYKVYWYAALNSDLKKLGKLWWSS